MGIRMAGQGTSVERRAVTLEDLYAILEREFGLARPVSCTSCVTPLPIRRAPSDAVSTNWFIVEPADCPHRCRVVLAEVVTRLMSEYELTLSAFSRPGPH